MLQKIHKNVYEFVMKTEGDLHEYSIRKNGSNTS